MERLTGWLKNHFNWTRLTLGVLVMLVFSVLVSYFLLGGSRKEEPPPSMILAASQTEEQSLVASLPEAEEEPPVVIWKADIKGAVAFPGVYEVEPGMRIQDLIDQAGGVRPDALVQDLNLAQLLEDQMMVYVPEREEVAAVSSEPVPTAPLVQTPGEKEAGGGLVDLNTADSSELQRLNGIGEKKAELIIQYRQEQGPFQTVEELMKVKGIGEKTFAALEDQITVSPQ